MRWDNRVMRYVEPTAEAERVYNRMADFQEDQYEDMISSLLRLDPEEILWVLFELLDNNVDHEVEGVHDRFFREPVIREFTEAILDDLRAPIDMRDEPRPIHVFVEEKRAMQVPYYGRRRGR